MLWPFSPSVQTYELSEPINTLSSFIQHLMTPLVWFSCTNIMTNSGAQWAD